MTKSQLLKTHRTTRKRRNNRQAVKKNRLAKASSNTGDELLKENERLRATLTELEEKLRCANDKITEGKDELDSFMYSVSHDLRAPLHVLIAFSDILLAECSEKLGDSGKDYLERIQSNTWKMSSLIDGLLKLSRISSHDLNLQPTNLSTIAQSIVNEIKLTDPYRTHHIEIQPNIIANVDFQLIKIALSNLFLNAWKFTQTISDVHIEFGMQLHDTRPVYYLRDNGVGFDMNQYSRLFKLFQRLHHADEFTGNGVGLAIVEKIIRRHQGTIWAESIINSGTTFYFTL